LVWEKLLIPQKSEAGIYARIAPPADIHEKLLTKSASMRERDLPARWYISSIPNMTPAASELHILPRDPLGPEALFLLREAAVEARRLYADLIDPAAPMPTNDPPQPGSIYLIAFLAESPVGCGALRKIDTITAEVRRMYVLSSARRAGIGRALLIRLEREADKLGYTLLKLETGNRQQAALAFYESYGFTRIPPFGPYVNNPISVCYAKKIQPCTI
jgi:putative acetyltransferase